MREERMEGTIELLLGGDERWVSHAPYCEQEFKCIY